MTARPDHQNCNILNHALRNNRRIRDLHSCKASRLRYTNQVDEIVKERAVVLELETVHFWSLRGYDGNAVLMRNLRMMIP